MIQLTKHNIFIGVGGLLGVTLILFGVYYITQKQTDSPVENIPVDDTIEEVVSPELSEAELKDPTSGFDLFPDDLSQDGMSNDEKRSLGLDPTEYDTDNDGFPDVFELEAGTDPLIADTDGDGLSDGQEVLVFGTDPRLVDTDGDTFSDDQEIEAGYSPLCAEEVLLFEACPVN